jgi:hypothetical protein
MTRWKASLIHLGLSAVIFVALLYLIVFQWYPQPYFAADGGWQGVQLITGVDLVLGPLLTLIVFKSGKPGLRRDLTLIGLVQMVALVWGTWLVHDQRIAMVTYADGAFYTLNSEQVRDAGGQAPAIAVQSPSTPPYAFVRLPADRRERQDLRLQSLFSGKAMHQLGERYELLGEKNLTEVLKGGVEIEKYSAVSEQNREHLERFLVRHGGAAQDYAFLPLHCRYQELLLALRHTDGSVVDTLDIIPSKTIVSPSPTVDKPPAK